MCIRDSIRSEACATGEMIKLNQEKLPGCYYYRTHPKDVARDEKRTVICTTYQRDAGPTNNLSLIHIFHPPIIVAPSQIPMNMEIIVCLVTKANTIVTSGGIRQSAP